MGNPLAFRLRPLATVIAVSIAVCGLRAEGQQVRQPQVLMAAPPVQAFVLNDSTFDQWVFGGISASPDSARKRLGDTLALKIDHVAQVCGADETQKQKLRTAGRGDIKRFFDRVDELRSKYVNVPRDPNTLDEILRELQPLQLALVGGLFDDRSLFSKTLSLSLTSEQAGRYERSLRDRALVRHRASVELTVAILDQSMGLTVNQRRRLSNLLRDETLPPAKAGPYGHYVVLLQTSKIPEIKIRPIFDEAQWRVLNGYFQRTKDLEPFLKQRGYEPERGPSKDHDARALH